MAAPAAILDILVRADTAGAIGNLKAVDGQVKSTAKGTKKNLAGAALVGGAAFVALGKGIGTSISEFRESQKVAATTAAIIKSTGGVANVSAKGIDKLSNAISRKTGIDDEAIATGSNLLLTFKNVQNQVGKGNNIFDQATAAAVDLSAAGFGSIDSASVMLGKALNDPLKGLTALGRAGVTFTADQQKTIKALIATGTQSDRLTAQQKILKEVQSQVGGTAAAQATSTDKMKVALGNLAETAGGVLVPALDKAARALTVGITFLQNNKTAAVALTVGVGALATALLLAASAQAAMNLAVLANPYVAATVAILALAAAVVYTYKTVDQFRAVVDDAFGAIKQSFMGFVAVIKGAVNIIAGIFTGDFGRIFSGLKQLFGGLGGMLAGQLKIAATPITAAGRALGVDVVSAITGAVSSVFGWFAGLGHKIADAVRGTLGDVRNFFSNVGRAIVDAIVGGLGGLAGRVKDKVLGALGGVAGDVAGGVKGILGKISSVGPQKLTLAGTGLASAMAALTKTDADDLKAAQDTVKYWENRLKSAKTVAQKTAAAQSLKSARDSLTGLTPVTAAAVDSTAANDQQAAQVAAAEENTAAINAHTDALKALQGEVAAQRRLAESAIGTQNAQAWKALADIMSGQIAGVDIAGRALTAGAGRLARY